MDIYAPDALPEGPHKFTATATDAAGNTGIPSASFTLTVDNTPPVQPGAPVITDDVAPVTGVVTNGNTNDTTPTFSGTGTLGIYFGYLDGNPTAGNSNGWRRRNRSFTPTMPINPDSYQITLTATDPAGNVSQPSTAITLNIDTTPPATPPIIAAK